MRSRQILVQQIAVTSASTSFSHRRQYPLHRVVPVFRKISSKAIWCCLLLSLNSMLHHYSSLWNALSCSIGTGNRGIPAAGTSPVHILFPLGYLKPCCKVQIIYVPLLHNDPSFTSSVWIQRNEYNRLYSGRACLHHIGTVNHASRRPWMESTARQISGRHFQSCKAAASTK